MKSKTNQKAVIYIRIASFKPPQSNVKNETVFTMKESRCREFINSKGYDLDTVFYDIGFSGNHADRPGIHDMLDYLDRHKKEGRIVIVDDISDLARNTWLYLEIRTAIEASNGRLESPAFEVDDCGIACH